MQTILNKEILTMKRIVIVMLALVFCMGYATVAFSASTFCDNGTCTYTSSTFGGGEYRPSSKVTVTVSTDTLGLAYCASSQHSGASTNQGAGRQFATLSNSPQIMFAASETTPGPKACTSTTPPALPSGPSWTSQ
jgi:hypothetical protein